MIWSKSSAGALWVYLAHRSEALSSEFAAHTLSNRPHAVFACLLKLFIWPQNHNHHQQKYSNSIYRTDHRHMWLDTIRYNSYILDIYSNCVFAMGAIWVWQNSKWSHIPKLTKSQLGFLTCDKRHEETLMGLRECLMEATRTTQENIRIVVTIDEPWNFIAQDDGQFDVQCPSCQDPSKETAEHHLRSEGFTG